MNISGYEKLLDEYGINTPQRRAAFWAQCHHESQGFTRFSENLNYSAKGLLKTWRKRFTPETARAYANQPVRIANFVYANRNGNGDEASGEGWKYRGAGFGQLTGRDNHLAFAQHVKMYLDDVGPYLRTEEGAVQSACWFWQVRRCNEFADTGQITKLSIRWNGGKIGLKERIALTERYKREVK